MTISSRNYLATAKGPQGKEYESERDEEALVDVSHRKEYSYGTVESGDVPIYQRWL